jgi:hypothetical protein
MKILVLIALMTFNLFAQEEESEALSAMRISCEKQKVGLGCFNYANMLIRADKKELADKFFELGCKYNHSSSCKKEKWDLPDVVITNKSTESPLATPAGVETVATPAASDPALGDPY